MDLLSEILQTVKLHGTVYFHARFQTPWGMEIPTGQYANFHIVTDGNCWLEANTSQEKLLLKKGDMVLFPRGDSHSLVDSPSSNIVSAEELINNSQQTDSGELVLGGDGSYSSSLICGHFEYDKQYPHPLFETLPSFIYIPSSSNPDTNWFKTASELAAQISSGNSIGKSAVINRLSESLFIQALAEYIESIDDPSSFLAAIQDKKIGTVLSAMHDNIAYDWNLAELAKLALMSKSIFSARFNSMVGEPPIIYLARWRMIKAREMLLNTSLPISQISDKVGYQSEYSFSKAFKKMTGHNPGALRKSATA